MIDWFWLFIREAKQKPWTFKHSAFFRLEHLTPGHENKRPWTSWKVTNMSSVWQLKTRLELVHGLNWDNLSLPRASSVSPIWISNLRTVSHTLNLYVAPNHETIHKVFSNCTTFHVVHRSTWPTISTRATRSDQQHLRLDLETTRERWWKSSHWLLRAKNPCSYGPLDQSNKRSSTQH